MKEEPKSIIFATHNSHKAEEIARMLDGRFRLRSLSEMGLFEEIPETEATLEGNAFLKASFVYQRFHQDCFADDTGLEVEALGGAPGVYSARYAGEQASFEQNIEKLLSAMQGVSNRKACFRTIICLFVNGQVRYFEGVVHGCILSERRGVEGFGYDPVFLPDGFSETFSEMDLNQKNRISHRGRAVQKLVSYLLESENDNNES